MAPADGVRCVLVVQLAGWGSARSPELTFPAAPRVGEGVTVQERATTADGRLRHAVRAEVVAIDHVAVQDDRGRVAVTIEVSALWSGPAEARLGQVVGALSRLCWSVPSAEDYDAEQLPPGGPRLPTA